MFYSHEVLTSRKYGVATVWLVATLGQKSGLKRLSRKAILDVNVTKACETILAPDAPLALRLQSNLLFGLTKVYSQQCGYVLTDAETARNNMRALVRLVKQADLDPEGANKAKPDQLMLQDDPNFLPDLDLMPLDLASIDFGTQDETQATLSPHSSRMVSGSQQSLSGLMVPLSQSSFGVASGGGLDLLTRRGDVAAGTRPQRSLVLDNEAGFAIDDEGNITDERSPRAAHSGQQSNVEATPRVEQDPTLTQAPISAFGDDYMPLQDGSSFFDEQRQDAGLPLSQAQSAIASVRRKTRERKSRPLDERTMLQTGDIKRWINNYLQRMRTISQGKKAARLAALAKKNAQQWVLGTGTMLSQGMPSPLDMFSGAQLLGAFTQINPLTGQKRAREDDDALEDDRRVRSRVAEVSGEVHSSMHNDAGLMPIMDDDTIEVGREAPTPMDDRYPSSVYPWNHSAGSKRPTDPAHPTSASYGPGGAQLNLTGRRLSRLTSASPLIGRGAVGNMADGMQLPGSDHHMGGMNDDEEFEIFGAAAQVDTQTAGQTQWQKAILGSESANFYSFVQNAIDEAAVLLSEPAADDDEDEMIRGSICLDALLPPQSNSHIVAAQAFLHVLALGTRNMLEVTQREAFGSITLRTLAV